MLNMFKGNTANDTHSDEKHHDVNNNVGSQEVDNDDSNSIISPIANNNVDNNGSGADSPSGGEREAVTNSTVSKNAEEAPTTSTATEDPLLHPPLPLNDNSIDEALSISLIENNTAILPLIPPNITVTEVMVESHPAYMSLIQTLDNLGLEYEKVCKEVEIDKVIVEELDQKYINETQRLQQEFSNMQERARREEQEVIIQAKAKAIRDVLPVMDDFHRAKAMFHEAALNDTVNSTEGERRIFEVYNNCSLALMKIIESFGAIPIETVGKKFDVNTMEAVMIESSTMYDKDHVTQEFQIGYRMGDKCVRPAMVAVSTGPGPRRPTNS
jgi:molecular chaperone GrpE